MCEGPKAPHAELGFQGRAAPWRGIGHETANDLIVDHVVPPADLRRELIARLDVYQHKHLPLPRKGHGTVI